jgi:phenylacetate-coenzyme A ligase PaaK-like adenylate-forming protein
MKEKPKVDAIFKYAVEKVDFYKSQQYEMLKAKRYSKIEYILSKTPIISGESFLDDSFYKFIPHAKVNISLFQTSGSSGKPKVIPATYNDLEMYVKAFIDMYTDLLGEMPSITINVAPPRPAISGVGMSLISLYGKSIELNPGPGQNILDIMKKAYSILYSHPEMNRKVLITSLPSLLLREIYNLDEKDLKELQQIASRNEVYIGLGGEPLNLERGRLLYSYIPIKGIINIMSSTERISGSKFYSEEMLKNEKAADTAVFNLSRYNNEFGVYSDGKIYYPAYHTGEQNLKGKEGELILTSKGLKAGDYAPLINYNMKELVKFVGIDDKYISFEFLGRTNKVTNFSVSKLNDLIADNVLAFTSRKLGLGEGYIEITREKGLDKMTFYFYKDRFNGDKEKVLETILEKLSKEEMELNYVISQKLGLIDVSLVEKDNIPFYDTKKMKSPKIVDKREIEHY